MSAARRIAARLLRAAATAVDTADSGGSDRLVIWISDKGLTRGKAAAAAVHAALLHAGAHHGGPVIVLGAPAAKIEAGCGLVVRDAGRTEVEPGTVTAGIPDDRSIT